MRRPSSRAAREQNNNAVFEAVRMTSKLFTSESGATLVEYGVALILAISAGGAAIVSLSSQTGSNMETACEVMQLSGRVENSCDVNGG